MVHRWVKAKRNGKSFFEAAEALRLILGQGVCSQVEDLIQEHILPPPKVTPPIPRLNKSVLSNLPSCLKIKPNLRRVFMGWQKGLARQGWRCLRQRMICPFFNRK